MKLLIATRSAGKQREFRRLLQDQPIEVLFPDDAGVLERPDREEALELHDSFSANARSKAEYFARLTGLPTIADDSGLEVFSLGGLPGVRSKRFAGAEGTPAQVDQANNAELLRRLLGAPEARRRARYRAVLAWVPSPEEAVRIYEGVCTGRILEQPAGTGGFGYDPLFFVDELGKSLGEATPEEKDRVSHRAHALRAWLADVALS
ncbi:MAG: non-canonical purine NTP pyrophosphatase [Gemmatimonadota bacterium]